MPGTKHFPHIRSTLRSTIIMLTVVQTLSVSPVWADNQPVPLTEAPGVTAVQQEAPKQALQPDSISGEYLKGYVSDTGKILSSPARWDGNDWLKAGLVVGATSGLLFADTGIKNFAQRNQSSAGDKAASVGNALGNPLYTLPPLGLFYLYGSVYDDPKARQTSLLAVESLALSGAFTWTLKLTAQRPRPYTGESSSTWNGPSLKTGDTSFPSGHTTAAFSIASVIAEEYGDNPCVPPIAYGLATLTGMARIYDNKHWASDTLFGGAIGYFTGKAVVKYHMSQTGSALRIMPVVSQQRFGMVAEYRF
jgi:membrane-associated phospholipid phosphatase